MKIVVHCLDHENALSLRLANYEAHKAYLASGSVRTVISGPLLALDGETMIGSLFLIEAEYREIAERFNSGDPFNKAGIWDHVTIMAFSKRQDNLSPKA